MRVTLLRSLIATVIYALAPLSAGAAPIRYIWTGFAEFVPSSATIVLGGTPLTTNNIAAARSGAGAARGAARSPVTPDDPS